MLRGRRVRLRSTTPATTGLTIDPAADNEGAIACYAKVGFKPVGVMRAYERQADGTWADGLLMELLADDRRGG